LGVAGDDRLVALIRAGDEGAFEVVYERYHRQLLSFSRHMLGNGEDAAEVVQQTFLSAYRDLTTSGKAIQLRAWLFAIARNRCLSMLRARREHADVDLHEPATDGLAVEVQRREDLRELLADLSRLPEDQRAALVLAELGSLDHEQIGDVVGCEREKVKALVFQARSSLAASRRARATSCVDIRKQLAVLSGGALRRTTLRRHLRDCAGCREFSEEVRRQRRAFAVILPVAPVAGLKEAVLSGAGGSGAAGTTVGAIGGTSGALGALGVNSVAAKVLVGAAIVGGAASGGVVAAGGIEGGSHVARGSRAAAVASAQTAGAEVSSVASQGVAFTRPSTAPPSAVAGSSPAASDGAPADALARGPGLKRGLSGTQPGQTASSRPGEANGRQNGAASGHGSGQSGKSGSAPPGNAYGHAKAPADSPVARRPAPANRPVVPPNTNVPPAAGRLQGATHGHAPVP
jgi:RNA polymerase sigma factor (sigma-70 family)